MFLIYIIFLYIIPILYLEVLNTEYFDHYAMINLVRNTTESPLSFIFMEIKYVVIHYIIIHNFIYFNIYLF